MVTTSVTLVALLLAGPAHAHKEKAPDWDPEAAKALETKVRNMFEDFDMGNVQTFTGGLDTTSITWDIGADGKPLAASTPAETTTLLEGYAAWMKEEAVTVKTTINKIECHSTSDFGFCALQFDQAFSGGTVAPMTQKFRATLISRKVDGQWRWSHWHASPREGTTMAQP
jgi:ketosteroid isomerase-like protein